MARFIDMTDAQKARVWARHNAVGGAGSPAAVLAEARHELADAEAKLAANSGSVVAKFAVKRARERLAEVEAR